ncbi:hypothetical protein DSO57_1021760 [Entomophthora muscae]|uniref:Uncharacterized protein n=1 Tax=Entomophthora muscae TaxID=34485 RepID=A0ACC2RUH1_9FUNG|nr:hypothetical protein DSO57_1021760 [Entomophthora muscae]
MGPSHPATQRPSLLHASWEGVQHPQTDGSTAIQASLDPFLALPPLRSPAAACTCLGWVPAGHCAAFSQPNPCWLAGGLHLWCGLEAPQLMVKVHQGPDVLASARLPQGLLVCTRLCRIAPWAVGPGTAG